MSVSSFLTLLVVAALSAFVFHSMLKLKVLQSGEGYLCELIIAWIGAWIGSPVLGYWSWMVPNTNVYLVPAIIGSMAAIYTLVALFKVVGSLLAPASLRDTVASPDEITRVA